MIRVVIDASVLLKHLGRAQPGGGSGTHEALSRGDYDFIAPALINYEIMNACSIAHRKGRIGLIYREILNEMFSLEILKKDIDPLRERIFEISCQFSQINASYVAFRGGAM